MSDDIRKRFDFPNCLIQSQAVGHLIAAVLKENSFSEKIHQSTNQTPALDLLWEKCCSDNVVVRTACCEALVALVAQEHAEFSYVLNGILNLIPSTRNTHGLIKAIMKLLQMQALKEGQGGEKNIQHMYSIRNHPQPLITVLEHRPDCWPVLLQQLTAFFQQCPERSEVSYVQIMAPFLWYLYCEPFQLEEYANLRLPLLEVLLQPWGLCDTAQPSVLEQEILRLCCGMIPCLQMEDLMQTTEAVLFIKEVYLSLLHHPVFWKVQLTQLTLQLFCVCEVSLKITGECSSLIQLLEHSVELLNEDFPVEWIITGIALLLLQTPASEQKPILHLALKLLSLAEGQKIPKSSLLLVMPLLQILSSTALEDCMSVDGEASSRQHLALNLLEMVQKECHRDGHHKDLLNVCIEEKLLDGVHTAVLTPGGHWASGFHVGLGCGKGTDGSEPGSAHFQRDQPLVDLPHLHTQMGFQHVLRTSAESPKKEARSIETSGRTSLKIFAKQALLGGDKFPGPMHFSMDLNISGLGMSP